MQLEKIDDIDIDISFSVYKTQFNIFLWVLNVRINNPTWHTSFCTRVIAIFPEGKQPAHLSWVFFCSKTLWNYKFQVKTLRCFTTWIYTTAQWTYSPAKNSTTKKKYSNCNGVIWNSLNFWIHFFLYLWIIIF